MDAGSLTGLLVLMSSKLARSLPMNYLSTVMACSLCVDCTQWAWLAHDFWAILPVNGLLTQHGLLSCWARSCIMD